MNLREFILIIANKGLYKVIVSHKSAQLPLKYL